MGFYNNLWQSVRFGKNVHAFDVQNFVTRGLSIGIATCQGCMFSVRGSF